MISLEEAKTNKYGIILDGFGLGDNLILSSLPENFYKNTGKKLAGICQRGILKYNPYIDNSEQPIKWFHASEICDEASRLTRKTDLIKTKGIPVDDIKTFSIPDRHRYVFSLPKLYLRHSRLYIHENSQIIPNKICVNTSGKSIGGQLSDNVIEQIRINYSNYKIVQIGGLNDKSFPGAENKLGLDIFETAKEISESAIYIGVDSGNFHIANCYPRVTKKIFYNYFDECALNRYTPLYTDAVWWEFNIQSFNNFEYDIGATMSYLKI